MLPFSTVLRRGSLKRIAFLTLALGWFSLLDMPAPPVQAQITAIRPDLTMGTTVDNTLDPAIYNIEGGTREGTNLFQSFLEFSVGTGDVASFNYLGPEVISNILARVSSQGLAFQSSIDGTLRSTVPGANLFIMNPNGIVFGPNARLDIGSSVGQSGSFYATTANVIRLADAVGAFFADPLQATVLTSAPVATFGFLGPAAPQAIQVQGSTLTVNMDPSDPIFPFGTTIGPIGQTLGLIGGELTIGADPLRTPPTLLAPSGRILLGSLASPGTVELTDPMDPLLVNTAGSRGNINILDGATLNVTDFDFGIGSPGQGEGGTIVIRGGQVTVDGISTLNSTTLGDVAGAINGVDIGADYLTLGSRSSIGVSAFGLGNGGRVLINATDEIAIAGTVSTTAGGVALNPGELAGTAGSIRFDAPDVTVTGIVESLVFADGPGGTIFMNVPGSSTLSVTNGGTIRTQTTSPGLAAPNVNITAGSFLLTGEGPDGRSSIRTVSDGGLRTGDINVTAGSGEITAGARIEGDQINAVPGSAGTGSITVNVTGTLTITGQDAFGAPSGIRQLAATGSQSGDVSVAAGVLNMMNLGIIQSFSAADGRGGNVNVNGTTAINMSGLSEISSIATDQPVGDVNVTTPSMMINNSEISARTTGAGDAGDIIGTFGTLTVVNNGSIDTSTSGTGNAGNITITTTGNTVNLSGGSSISSASTGTMANAGDAGMITINSASTITLDNSSITTEAKAASGGQIELTAPEMIRLTNSKVTTSVAGGPPDAGDISIDPYYVILQNSQIIAQAFAGTGGNITITANVFLADPGSLVDASSTLGVSGTVDIRSPVSNVAKAIGPLSEARLAVAELLQAACAARLAEGQASSFVSRGRDSIPVGPDGLLASPFQPPSLEAPAAGTSLTGQELSVQVRRLLGTDPTLGTVILLDDAVCRS